MVPDLLEQLAQLGAAGVMGALWLSERVLAKKRERELTEAHALVMQGREHLKVLVRLVRRNTQAVQRFDSALNRVIQILERSSDDRQNKAT